MACINRSTYLPTYLNIYINLFWSKFILIFMNFAQIMPCQSLPSLLQRKENWLNISAIGGNFTYIKFSIIVHLTQFYLFILFFFFVRWLTTSLSQEWFIGTLSSILQKYFQKLKTFKKLPWKHAHHDIVRYLVWMNLLVLKRFLKVNENNDKKEKKT